MRWRWIESMNWVIRPVWIIGQKNNIEPMAIDECDWMSLPFSYTKITCIVLTISTPTNQKKNTQTQKGKWIYNMHTYNAKHNYPRAFGKMYRIFFILVYFNHRHGTNKRELRRGRDFWLNYHHRKTKEQEIEHMRTTWTLNHCVK